MQKMFVKPAIDTVNPERAGLPLIVRDPTRDYSPLPDEGGWVAKTQYWMTALANGSVIESQPPGTKAPRRSRSAPPDAGDN